MKHLKITITDADSTVLENFVVALDYFVVKKGGNEIEAAASIRDRLENTCNVFNSVKEMELTDIDPVIE